MLTLSDEKLIHLSADWRSTASLPARWSAPRSVGSGIPSADVPWEEAVPRGQPDRVPRGRDAARAAIAPNGRTQSPLSGHRRICSKSAAWPKTLASGQPFSGLLLTDW